ncbi:gluconate 2-dehydrogenase subunit 3 family protein [Tardiphaga sp.]|uniref:gluconate 2-dehydrogenase subunit 3 family protein n=1 Tax=Tardiphaga sp. TaxID=1926292 RepID=UPI00352A63F9
MAGVIGTFSDGGAFAATLKSVKPAAAPALLKVARDLYPHDRLPDAYYETAVTTIDAGVAADQATKTLLSDGVTALDAAAVRLKGRPYTKIAPEADRIAVLKSIEDTPFFTKMRSEMITALYNQPEVWTKLGYEGSSAELGGYIHRGFNDLDWLPA